jgi:hypothetical protein
MKKLVIGGVFIFFGAFMLLGFAVNLSEKSFAIDIGDIVAFILLSAAPIVAGSIIVRSHFTGKRKRLEAEQKMLHEQREREIIRLAQQKRGRLTIPEIAVATSMTTEEADEMMREMTAKGYVDMQVTDSGVIVYEFYEIAHRELEE